MSQHKDFARVRFARMKTRPEPDAAAFALYEQGDCIPVWVNEGDILRLGLEIAVEPTANSNPGLPTGLVFIEADGTIRAATSRDI